MKSRARRVTIGAAILAVALVAVLAVVYLGTVRDHVEAWHFQFRNKTTTILPAPALTGIAVTLRPTFVQREYVFTLDSPGDYTYSSLGLFHVLADYAGCPVIIAFRENAPLALVSEPSRLDNITGDIARAFLQASGYRVLEQRFPRSAFVVIRDQGATQ